MPPYDAAFNVGWWSQAVIRRVRMRFVGLPPATSL
jgi:hypothetical protein